jgi:hypothetical protein
MTLDARPLKYKDDAVGLYAKTWAAPNTNRSGIHFLERFPAIDVGCTYDVESSGEGAVLPRLVFNFADGSSTRAEPGWPDHFRTRPAVCEYARGPRESDAAMLLVSSSTDYLFRLWPLFLNKILYATEAKLRLFIWIGELPAAATRATAAGCYLSQPNRARFDQKPLIMHAQQRKLADSYTTDSYDIKDVTRVSNHHVKMPATLAVLAHPSIRGVYYVDLDSVAQLPFNLTNVRRTHGQYADVIFKWTKKLGPSTLRWKVMGSRFYVRDTVFGRRFFERWFDNRCSFKDQYSLWHTILELSAEAGCVDYEGEIWERHSYDSVRHMKPSMAGAELQLTCDVIHEKCPAFKYGNEGPSNQCVYGDVPDVLDNVLHHAIPPDGPGLREVAYGSQKLVVENTCFYAGNRARIDDQRDIKRGLCKYAGSWREYLEKLGVVGRDTSVHPWGE